MTTLQLQPSVPFPVTISAVFYSSGQSVQKHCTLLKYKYWDYQDDPNLREDPPRKVRVERVGTFESPIEGEVVLVNVRPQQEIAHSGVVLYTIAEACTHTVQYGGLCALCGKAVEDEKDYSGYSYDDRATIAMSHDNTGLKISMDEAAKIENSSTLKLVEDRKLILVVDLDQTVIHATVDPTVGEWQHDVRNPNYPYVKDVRSFCLDEEPVLPAGWTGPRPPASKCWYYVKLRPGLQEFLQRVFQLYELHIYTMATRSYALAIANIIDPDRRFFGDRILSRDESGLLTHKNLKRLFPVDQSMVAIIDDRGDVWQWEPNLIKVVPYDFFVGIGDINLSFLPKKNGQLLGPSKKRKTIAKLESMDDIGEGPSQESAGAEPLKESAGAETSKESAEADITKESTGAETAKEPSQEVHKETEENLEIGRESHEQSDLLDTSTAPKNPDSMIETRNTNGTKPDEKPEGVDPMEADTEDIEENTNSPVNRIYHLGGGENNQELLQEQVMTRSQLVEKQQHERPLAKLQHNLDRINHDHVTPTPESPEEEEEESLLRDDDTELITLRAALETIHNKFYERLEQQGDHGRPDLATIIPELKRQCLQGVVVLFSGILPLGMSIDNADIVVWSRQFGVRVVNEVYPEVTHVVCRDPNSSFVKGGLTLKVRVAKQTIPGVKIVSPDWLFLCLSQWKKVSEEGFLINVSDKDWHVSASDVSRYQKGLEAQRHKAKASERRDSSAIEEYDFNDANAEVDDFLAGLSEDEDDDEDEDVDRMEEDAGQESKESSGSSFLRGLYSENKRKRETTDDESEHSDDGGGKKFRSKVAGEGNGEDLDELEQELLDELDHLTD